jgi:hypothetical protein
VANLARVDRPREAEAAAKALLASNRNDPWGWFAQTFVGEYAAESGDAADVLTSSLEAYRPAPGNPTIVWLRAFALSWTSWVRVPSPALWKSFGFKQLEGAWRLTDPRRFFRGDRCGDRCSDFFGPA